MAVINFPDPSQSPWTNTVTGVTYTYINGAWKVSGGAGQTAPELFVDVDGDNLTGNLTLGTDKIVLNATDGSATFAGNVNIANSKIRVVNSVDVDTVNINGSDGSAWFKGNVDKFTSAGTHVSRLSDTYLRLYSSPQSVDDYKISLNTDGSASFAGNLNVSGFVRGGANNTLYIADDIALTSGKSLMLGNANTKISSDGIACTVDILGTEGLRINDGKVSIYSGAIDLNYNGSATFGAAVEVNSGLRMYRIAGDSSKRINIGESDDLAVWQNDGNFSIKYDGSAEFAGGVKSDHSIEVYNRDVGAGKGGAVIGLAGKDTASERGFMTLYANTLVEPAFRIMTAANDTDSKTVKVGFYNDGSATFGSLNLGSGTTHGVTIDQTAGSHSGVRVQSTDTATSVGEFFAGYRGSSMAFQVTTGGALKAASGAFEVDASGIIQTNINTAGIVKLNSTADFANPKIELSSIDGSATFAGHVTTNGLNIYTLAPLTNGGQLGYDDSTKSLRLYSNSSLGTNAKTQFHFNQSGTADITFNEGGSATFGTTTSLGSHLTVSGSQSGNGSGVAEIRNTSSNDASPSLVLSKTSTTTSSSARFIQFYANNGSTPMGGIVGSGASAVQFASISDVREKENIQSLTGSLEKVKQLEVVEFDWKESGEHVKAGFTAQNVETVFPEYVVDNLASEGMESRKGVTGGLSGGYIAVLTAALQEAVSKIETLEAKVAALEAG